MIQKENDSLLELYNSAEKQNIMYKKSLMVVSISQILGGAGLAAGVTVGALLAEEMLGSDAYAGLPSATLTLGSAFAAFMVGSISQKFGRRFGLSLGFMLGGIGAVGVIFSALLNNIVMLFLSLFIYGSGSATNLQARYAGTDLASEKQRATAISIAMVFTTFGAVVGPNLVDELGELAILLGLPSLVGPFILGAIAYFFAGLVIFILLRPDPFIVAKSIKKIEDKKVQSVNDYKNENKKGIIVGATMMILTQIVMVSIMTMTPVHMMHHGHMISAVGVVIGFHVAVMYLPSLVTGILIDKLGRTKMGIIAGVILLSAGIIAAFSPGESIVLMVLALSLLGLGWNIGLISGTAMIIDSTSIHTRAKTQGKVDFLVSLSGATGGVMSGGIVAGSSYFILSISGGLLALLLIPVIIISRDNG